LYEKCIETLFDKKFLNGSVVDVFKHSFIRIRKDGKEGRQIRQRDRMAKSDENEKNNRTCH